MKLIDLLSLYAGRPPMTENEKQIVASDNPRAHVPTAVNLPSKVTDWPPEWRESFEERAAIIEFDGNSSRTKAEQVAEKCVREAFRRQLETETR